MKRILVILLLLPVFVQGQIITTFAGGGVVLGDGGPATAAITVDPNGGVFDKYGNYYFTEATGQRVRKVNTVGIITTVAGGGSGGLGDGGLATSATLSSPTAVILDTFGNLYIDDANNERIRKVNITTGIITTICGNGTGAFYGDSGPATLAEIWGPDDICFDKFGNLYISDLYNYRVRKIDPAGNISTFAGSGGFSSGGTGDGGPATLATFNLLAGIVADDTGNIYIADYNAGKVHKVDLSGIISTIAGSGVVTYSGDGIPATAASIAPTKLGFDNLGNLYIADKYNRRVYKVDHAGILHNVAGDGMTGYGGDGMPATAASIDFPGGVSFDSCGNLYIPDVSNKRIRKVIFDTTGIPSISITATPEGIVCADTAVMYSAAVIAGTAISYQWYVDGSNTGATSSTYTYTPANGDSVRCLLIGVSQCSGDTVTVSSNTITMAVDTCTTAGHISVAPLQAIGIYPNPATTQLTISAPQNITSITITNLLGQTVYSSQLAVYSLHASVDISALPASIYFVKVNGKEVKKFVKE